MRLLLPTALSLALACATTRPPPAAPAPAAAERPLEQVKADADAARQTTDWAAMQRLYREVARREPRNAEALTYAGYATVMLGQREEGARELEQSLAVQDTAVTRYLLAGVMADLDRPEDERKHLERAVELDPDAVRLWLALALARAKTLDLDAAFAAADKVKALAPDSPRTDSLLMMLSELHSASGRDAAALQHMARGMQSVQEGDDAQAASAFRAALELEPTFADAHYNLGVVLRRAKDLKGAEQAYRAAIANFRPREELLRADAQNNLADLLVSRGARGQEPVTLARAAIAVRGERPSYLDTLARACDASGDRACAVEAFGKLLAGRGPLPPEVKAHAEARLEALRR